MITKEDLINRGFKPKLCKIGTLYFNAPFFCMLKDGKADVRTISDDMHTFRTIDDISELDEVYLDYHRQVWLSLKLQLQATEKLIKIYEDKISGSVSQE